MPVKKIFSKNTIIYCLGVGLFIFMFIFFVTASQIGFGVKEMCRTARNKYEGDCVQALIHFLDDGGNDFENRNSAIWALGQLGDHRALPVIAKYYQGNPENKKCDRSTTLCQYELFKAIKLLKGGLNITAFVWRNGDY